MKDLVSLFEEGDRCGYCQEFWHNCKCLQNFGDDLWGDDYPDYHEQRQTSAWPMHTKWW